MFKDARVLGPQPGNNVGLASPPGKGKGGEVLTSEAGGLWAGQGVSLERSGGLWPRCSPALGPPAVPSAPWWEPPRGLRPRLSPDGRRAVVTLTQRWGGVSF